MKSNRNKALWWVSATGNRQRGKLRKVTLDQFVQWTKDWEAFDKAPQCYRLADDKQIFPCIDGRSFRRNLWDVKHKFGGPKDLLWPVDTLYYDNEKD